MNVIIKGKATRIEFLNRSSVINSIEISANIINNIPDIIKYSIKSHLLRYEKILK